MKTQELQYGILNNYLNTNVRLKKLEVIDDDTCSFCKQAPETREHLLITCKHVQKFWKDLLGWYPNGDGVPKNKCLSTCEKLY